MKKVLMLLAVLLSATTVVSAQVVEWRGVNTSFATSLEQMNVDDASLWQDPDTSEYRLPTVDDEAKFSYNSQNFIREDLIIPSGSAFVAKKISILGLGYQEQLKQPLYLQKSLTLDSVYLQFGYTSGGQGDNILRVGTPDMAAALMLRQVDQDAVAGVISLTGSSGTANIDFSSLTPYDPTDSITQAATRNARRTEILGLINAETATTGVSAAGTGDITLSATAPGSANFVYVVAGAGTFNTTGTKAAQPLTYDAGFDYTASTLTLTGEIPVDLASTKTGNIRTKWMTIMLYAGSKLEMTNSNITLIQQTQATNTGCSGGIGGTGGSVEFTAVGGTVNLVDPGLRSDGSINVGRQLLKLRSDQTWTNSSGLGYIKSQILNPNPILESIDGGRLDNLAAVPLVLAMDTNSETKGLLAPGTYGGLTLIGSLSSGRTCYIDLTGDTTVAGSAVIPGNDTSTVAAIDPDYSLRFQTSGRQRARVRMQGYNLTLGKGLHLWQNASPAETANAAMLDARTSGDQYTNSVLTIGGRLYQDTGNPLCLPGGGTGEIRYTGIWGDPLTVVVLKGDYVNLLRSMANEALSRSKLQMDAGTPAAPQMLEVMGAPAEAFVSGTSTIGELAVGNGVDPAYVKLVNNNRNDGGDVWEEEVLLARNLRVLDGAVLDCNLYDASANPTGAGGVKLSPPNKFGAISTSYDVGAASGIHTIVGKNGIHSFDIDDIGGTTITQYADAINAGTATTGVACRIDGSNAIVEAVGDGSDDFFIIRGNIGTRYSTTKNERNAAGLFIAPTGTLDLNTGRLLVAGDKVMEFWCDGDQTAAWNVYKAGVIDSSNPDLDFEAVTHDIQDYELDPEADPILITVWAVAAGGQPDPIDASVAIAPDFVYQNNLTTGGRHKAVMTVTVNNVVGTETYTVTVDGIADSMISVAAGTTDLTKNLVGGTRNVAPTGLCSFNVTVTDSLGRSTAAAIPASVMVRKLGDIDGNGFVEPTDKGLLNSKLNGVSVPGVAFEAFDLDGNGFAEPTDKGLLNNILNGVTVN